MPAQQSVYEGTDLQALIQRVVDEHGPARIRPPERRRKGGVLGFFAREVYVISVDREATERAGRTEEGTGGHATASLAAAGTGRRGRRPATASSPAVAGTLADLIDATEDDLHLGSSASPAPASSAGGSGPEAAAGGGVATGAGTGGTMTLPRMVKPFSQVLSEVASSLGEEPGTYRVDPDRLRRITPLVPPPATATEIARPEQAVADMIEHPAGTGTPPATDPGPAPAGAAGTLTEPATAAASTPAPAVAPSPATVSPAPGTVAPPSEPDGPAAEAATLAAASPACLPPVPAAAPREAMAAPVEAALAPVEPVAPPVEAAPSRAPAARPARRRRRELGIALVDLLLAAGFPETLLPQDVAALSGLEEAFALLPEAPPLPATAGGLVAVVGDARLVRPVARSVASRVRCPPDEVAVVAPSARHATPAFLARTPDQAASLAGGWRRDRVGVVAVYAPALGTDQQWTRDVLRAVRPSCVWATATATTKPEDVRRWVDAVGGADALAVNGVAATTTPAAILSIGLPVARLDDERATAQRWAAVVANLLTRS